MKSNRFTKPLIIACAIIVALFLLGLIGTPYLIDMGLERWIASQGPEIGQVENIDFNPFSSRLSMDNLVVETQSGRTFNITHAYLKFSWKQLFKKQLYLEELVLQDAYMLVDHLDERGLRVGGLILRELFGTEGKSDTPGWEVGVERFVLENAQIRYDTPELTATYYIDQYTLTGLETWNKKKAVKMAFNGRINESPVQVEAEVVPFDAIKSWKGSVVLKEGSLELISKVRGLQEYAPSGTLDLDLELDAQRQENGSITLDTEGTVTFKNLLFQYEQYGLQQKQITWQGRISGSKAADEGLVLEVNGQLSGTDMVLDNSVHFQQLMLSTFSWQGNAEINQQPENLSIAMKAGLAGSNISANDMKNDTGLLSLEELNLAGIEIGGLEDIQVAHVDLQNLRLFEKIRYEGAKEAVPPLLQSKAIEMSKIRLQGENGISISDIKVQDAETHIQRDKEGSWQFAGIRGSEDVTTEPSAVDKAEPETGEYPFKFQLGSLQVGGKSFVSFTDESLPRPFRTIFHIHELSLAEINTADAHKAASFTVKGQVGDYGTVAFDGTASLSEKPITLDTKGTITSIDMPPFSSYTGQAIGYNVTSGQMDADIAMNINRGKMDGKFGLHMRNLEVAQVDPGKEPEVDKQMDVPLGSALSMLRNKKDEINLELKLQGDITKPEFGIQDAINQALAKAMQFAALSYLKYTLQPFGTYIAIAEVIGKAGKEMSKVGLDPVLFPAGEIALDETANQYLGKIKELLNNRPKLRIELCGRAVAKDRAALLEKRQAAMKKTEEKSGTKQGAAAEEITVSDDVLLDFAKERAKLVKESLVKEHGIEHERIYLCLPAIDEDPEKVPYVELLLD